MVDGHIDLVKFDSGKLLLCFHVSAAMHQSFSIQWEEI